MTLIARLFIQLFYFGPCALFFVGAFAANRKAVTIVSALLALVLSTLINVMVGIFASVRNARDVLILLQAPNQVLYELDVSQLKETLPKDLAETVDFQTGSAYTIKKQRRNFDDDELRSRYGKKFIDTLRRSENLRVFIRRFTAPPYDHVLKAYVSRTGTSFIFLLDDPHQLGLFSRFKLYHELAHVSMNGAIEFEEGERAIATMVFIIVITALVATVHPVTRIMAFGLPLAFLAYVRKFAGTKIRIEQHADRVALNNIASVSKEDAFHVCHLLENLWNSQRFVHDPPRQLVANQRLYEVNKFRVWLQRGRIMVGDPSTDFFKFIFDVIILAIFIAMGYQSGNAVSWWTAMVLALGLIAVLAIQTAETLEVNELQAAILACLDQKRPQRVGVIA